MRRIVLGLAVALGLTTSAAAVDPFAQTRIGWNKPVAPFRLIGNVYYVGMADIAVYLIVTPKGDILTDGGLPESVPLIEKNIKALGVKLADIKILLNSHAHFDHAGGLAELKRATGAKLYASAADKPILERGYITFGPSASIHFPPAKVDHVVKDGEVVRLGDAALTAHLTPGHTPGCTTYTMPVIDGDAAHDVVFYCSTTVAGNPLVGNAAYPKIASDYEQSFAKLKAIHADVFLGPHASFYGMAAKRARMAAGAPNPFVDAGEFQRFVAQSERDFAAELAKQQAGGKP